jgi:hypothetical protein
MLLQNNPNVLSLLWLQENHVINAHPLGRLLIENREIFSSKVAYHSFTGYAHSQLKRMTRFDENAGEGYMGAKRKALAKEMGYDTKNASHLIRLLRMGIEFMSEGILHVERDDAPELLEIKKGEWSLMRVQQHADEMFALSREAVVRSNLPAKPDREKAEALSIEIISKYHGFEVR